MRRPAITSRPSWAIDAPKTEPETLCAFDLLACDGRNMRYLPLVERRRDWLMSLSTCQACRS
jgi:hypothetical protein